MVSLFAGILRTPGNGEETLRLHVTLLALQVSIDHLRALNATSVELQEGQQHLEPPVQAHRERLLTPAAGRLVPRGLQGGPEPGQRSAAGC